MSPVTLLATLAVLSSGRGRVNGLVYLTGFLIGQAGAFLVAFFVGSTWVTGHEGGRLALDALELALGLLLLGAARATRRQPASGDTRGLARVSALLGKLRDLSPTTAFPAGAALGVGTKRFVITVVAAAGLAASGLDGAEQTGLSILYVVLATVLVWLPVGLYLIAGSRADGLVEHSQGEIEANWRPISFWLSLVFGLAICADALAKIVG